MNISRDGKSGMSVCLAGEATSPAVPREGPMDSNSKDASMEVCRE